MCPDFTSPRRTLPLAATVCGLVALVIWLPFVARSAVVPSATGLIAAYSFDEGAGATTADATGNGHTGAISGATWTTEGRYGAGLVFDGADDWVTVADSALLDLTGGMTLEAWVYPTVMDPSFRTVILKEQAADLCYALYAQSWRGSNYGPSAFISIAGGYAETPAVAELPAHTWTHLAAAYDGATLRLYVNGSEAGSVAASGSIATSIGPLRFGGNAIWGEWFAGRLDEIRIYDHALNAAEIQADMAAAIGGDPTITPTPTATSTSTQTRTATAVTPLPTALILTVRDTAGIARAGEVVRSGVPLPRSLNVRDPAALTLVDPHGSPVPAEFEVLARWDAGRSDATAAIQWLLVTFPASVPAGSSAAYRLVTDGSAGPNPTPTVTVSVTQNGNQVTVDTGSATFRLGGDPAALFDEICLADGTTLVGGSAMTATLQLQTSEVSHTTTSRLVIEHAGPLAAVIVVEGTYDLPAVGGGGLSDRRRYVFTAGSPVAIVRHAVNWEGDRCGAGVLVCDAAPNGLQVERVRDALMLAPHPQPLSLQRAQGRLSEERGANSPLPSQGRGAGGVRSVTAVGAFASPAITGLVAPGQPAAIRQLLRAARTDPLAFEVSVPGTAGATGEKADGGMLAVSGDAGTVAVALSHLHRYEPQALRLTEDGRLAIDLADDSAWLGPRQGLFATFAVAALPAAVSRDDLDRLLWAPLNRPLRGWPSPAWFAASDAVDEFPVGGLPADLASYDTLILTLLTRTLAKIDEKGLPGLMTFGVYPRYWGEAVYGDELDCEENDPTPTDDWDDTYWCSTWTDYHNTIATAPIWAMRSGQTEWLDEIAFPGALRTLHTQIMQCATDDTYFYCGQAPAGYGAYRMDFNGSHAYFDNLFLYYWLTGDYTVVETLTRGASSMRNYLCSRRPAESCLPDDPPADEWAHLSGRVASQWYAAFRFVGLAGADAGYLDDYRSGLARAVTQRYVEAEQAGITYGFWIYGVEPITAPGTYSTDQLWMASLYDMNNLFRLQRDTDDAGIGNPAIPPSQAIAAWARTLVRFGATTAGDGTAAGLWPNALYFTWEGDRIGGSLTDVAPNTSGGDPYLWDTGKANLTAVLTRAGDATGDPNLLQMGADLTGLTLDSALSSQAPLGKIQGLYLARLHPAVARLAGHYPAACRTDVTADGQVNAADRLAVVSWWRRFGYPPVNDQNGSGGVDVADLQAVIGQAGQPCATPTRLPTATPTPTPTATATRLALNVPLRVRDDQGASGVDRVGDPVTSGVPLPLAADITDATTLRVLGLDGQPIPAQLAVLARWGAAPDDATRPIKWVLADFQADVTANGEVTYTLDAGGGGLAGVLNPAPLVPAGYQFSVSSHQFSVFSHQFSVSSPQLPISITETLTDFLIDTGPARFRIRKQGVNLFDQVWVDRDGDGEADDPLLLSSEGPTITVGTETYRAALGPVDEAAIELAGPLHTIIRVAGRHANAAAETLLAYTARLHFYAGQSSVRVFYGVWNDWPLVNDGLGQPDIKEFGSPNTVVFDDLTVGMRLDVTGAGEYLVDWWNGRLGDPSDLAKPEGPGEVILYQDSSGGSQWHHEAISAETTFRGYTAEADGVTLHGPCDESADPADCRAQGWLGIADTGSPIPSGVAVGVRHFWQNYPKRLAASADGRLEVGLFPGQYAALFELRVGERKTHELLFYFHAGADVETVTAQMQRLQSPLRAWAPAAWYADSGALGPLEPFDATAFAAYEGYNDAAIIYPAINFAVLHEGVSPTWALYLPRAEQWGWRNFGDTTAEDEGSSDWPPIFHNGQYDHPYYFTVQALRTLDALPGPDDLPRWRHWWDLAEASARHQADVDIVHGYCTGLPADLMSEPLCLDATQGPPYGIGWAWGSRLTNQWHADPSPHIHRYGLLDYWSGGIRGLTWYYYLTGEAEARDGWLAMAENARWRLANSPCDPSCGPGYSDNDPVDGDARGPAYGLEIMADAYAATGDPVYRTWAADVLSDSHPSRLFFGQPGFTVDFNLAPSGSTLRVPFAAMLVKSGGYYASALASFGISDPALVSWLHEYGRLLASAWRLGTTRPLCATLGENGGCAMDEGEILSLLVADGLAAALEWGQPTEAERAAWEAVAGEAWQLGSEHPWGNYAPATFMTAKSQVLYGISGHWWMQYARARGLLPAETSSTGLRRTQSSRSGQSLRSLSDSG